jgi:glycosyltransferase involved in cell wall biosynthesis
MSGEGEIAYIMKGFPRLSETFIANEIHLLETMGMRLRLYSVKRPDKGKTHEVVTRISAPIRYLPEATSLTETPFSTWLRENVPNFAAAHARVFHARPWAYLRALRACAAMCLRYRGGALAAPRKVFIKEFLQAGAIADDILCVGSIRHLHGHFCHGATTITWFVSQLTGLPFSFTAHAKDIYQDDLNPGDLLMRKLEAASFATTCTGANHRHLAERFPGCKLVHTVYHGLDTDYFAPPPEARTAGEPLILTVGRFVEKKGFAYLVEACARLKSAGIPFRCLMVGEDGDQSKRIARMIEALRLSDVLSIAGPKTQEELRAVYREASVFALPCIVTEDGDRDGIPNVLAEAMASGVPIVSTPISGIPELVQHEVEGLLVPARDSEALAGAIARLLADHSLRARLAGAARRRICASFDSKKTTLQLKQLFVSAMGMETVST